MLIVQRAFIILDTPKLALVITTTRLVGRRKRSSLASLCPSRSLFMSLGARSQWVGSSGRTCSEA